MYKFMLNETSYHGAGAIKAVPEEIKARGFKKVFVASDPDLVKFGVTKKVTDLLDEACIEYVLYSNIKPNPTIENVQTGVAAFKEAGADCIVAIGGGSSMDTSKAIGIIITNPEFADVRSLEGVAPTKNPCAPIIAVPTTAGTAAEVTINYVITDVEKKRKFVCVDNHDIPVVAVVDPEMMSSMPKGLTAATGMDALTHAIEAYVSILASDFTDGWAKQAVKLVFENLEKSVLEGDPDARIKMHNAASIAGMAFANAFLGMNHSLAHKIGGEWHIPHGRTNGMLLPHVIRYNGTVPTKLNIWPKIEDYKADKKYRELAELIGLHPKTDAEGVEMFAQAVEKLWVKVGGAVNVKSQNISKADWEESVHRIAMNAYEDQCTPANPRMPMVKDMEAILETIYDYESPFAKK